MADLSFSGGYLALLTIRERAALGELGHWRTYRRGERLFLEGDQSDAVFVVADGRARVYSVTSEGNEVTLSVRGPGDLIGEMGALVPGGRRSASVSALVPLRCRVLSATELHRFLEGHPQAALALLQLVIGRLRHADRRRAEFGSYDTTRRLARVLLEVAADAGADPAARSKATVQLGLALTQQELAGLVGASRESVARALAELRRRGMVTTGRRAITIRDLAALHLYAG